MIRATSGVRVWFATGHTDVTSASDPLPSDLAAAHAMILAEKAARQAAQAQVGEFKKAQLAIEAGRLEVG